MEKLQQETVTLPMTGETRRERKEVMIKTTITI